jgi:hypothetical protein
MACCQLTPLLMNYNWCRRTWGRTQESTTRLQGEQTWESTSDSEIGIEVSWEREKESRLEGTCLEGAGAAPLRPRFRRRSSPRNGVLLAATDEAHREMRPQVPLCKGCAGRRDRCRWNPAVGWYISNVSIIFDAPCLFLHHLPCVSLHFVAFYAISGTNLLTRCQSASSLFSAIFVFQKSYTGNILGIGRNKFQKSYISWKSIEDRTRAGGGPGVAHTIGGRGPAPGRAHLLWGHPGRLLTMPLCL